MGPITIFDKSFLQALNPDEAALFDALYSSNITPVFFIETLADLVKEMRGGKTPEAVVGGLAYKTPVFHSYPNAGHWRVCVADLLGYHPMPPNVPALAGGRSVHLPGKTGIVFEHPPEMQALERWRAHDFLIVERMFARQWRTMIESVAINLQKISAGPKCKKISNLQQAKAVADDAVRGNGKRWLILRTAIEMLGVSPRVREAVIERWKAAGGPSLPDFAPYTAHVLTVEVFFHVAVATGHISDQRGSNRADIAYLFYLPFAEMFVSGDRLHERTAPLFLNEKQKFVRAADLKADLRRLDEYYSGHPDVAEHGLLRVAACPPTKAGFLTSELYDCFRAGWRQRAQEKITPPARLAEKLLGDLQALKQAPTVDRGQMVAADDTDMVTIERRVPLKWGKWQFLPKGVKGEGD